MFAVAPALCMLPLFASATAVEEAAAQTAAGPVTKLLYTMATTSLAIGVGCLAVRLGFVDPERGQMVALRWYVRMVASPLLVFRVVATSPIGALQLDQWYVVLSCAVGKLFVMVTVWLLAFYCHHGSSTETSQRLLTATCFMYFVASSDDFAVGFPVVTAIYKNELGMDLYVTINTLVSSAVFLPIVTVLLEVGRNMALAESARGGVTYDEFSGSDSGSDVDTSNDESIVTKENSNKDEIEGSGALVVSLAIAKSVAFSPVIVSVALGLMYGSIFGTVIPELGTMIIDKLTSPFGMLALFATGTVLKQPSLQLWSCLLSLLKVVVCAYVSFFTARFLMGSEGRLTDFCFFYGSLPTSSGPLLFTVQYNPGLVDTVASATLFGYCLAGPVMSFTAMFLEQENVSPDILSNAQRVVCGVSFLLGMLFILSLVASGARGRWGFSSRGNTVADHSLCLESHRL
ncbi:unnamed protein product [Prorocentrum cordatum]|uniref:Amino acid transporter n=1 Tax=Prorocentrum cordatum TaxID=2364126 RepID=A0ABN9T6B7_9DINO|nr:unnamed protein product [Polarella glacialis]